MTMIVDAVEDQLAALLPKMRTWALALARNAAAADDLVQDVAAKVLTKKDSFAAGTNFNAWVHRIMVNQFITGVRTRRDFVSVEEIPEIPLVAEQHGKIELERLNAEFVCLPAHLREVLRQIAVEERSYEEVAKAMGCPVGTLKSRVHRARSALRARLEGHEQLAA
jgi:RNA polymerase sigma-70 factor, ECF subfamily